MTGNANNLGDLPSGWVWAKLSELCDPVETVRPAGHCEGRTHFRYIDLGAIDSQRIVAAQNLEVAQAPSRARQVVRSGDTLFSCVRVYLQNVSRVPPELDGEIASTAFAVLRPAAGVNADYLFWLTRRAGFIRAMTVAQRGNSPPAVLEADVKSAIVPVAPKAEQQRIGAMIAELFGEIEAGEQELERAREGLEAYRRSVLKAAVSGELTREWRERNRPNETGEELLRSLLAERPDTAARARTKVLNAPDDGALSELPPGWVWTSLDQLSWDTSYGTSAKCSPSANGAAVLRIPNIKRGSVDPTNLKFSMIDLALSDDDWVSPGDLLVVRTNGSENLIGRGGVAIESLPGQFYFASYLIRFRLLGDADLWKWISIVWDSPIMRGFVKRNAASSAGQFNISQSKLSNSAIPIPPAPEMKAAIQTFETLSIAIDEMEAGLAEALPITQLRQALLSSAFAGKLVPQDNADEPANVLLERLRAERNLTPNQHRRNARPRVRTSGTRGSELVEAAK